MIAPMTPRDRLFALMDTRELRDYGLSVSEQELRTFPEGRALLLSIRLKQRRLIQAERFMARCGAEAGASICKITDEVFNG